MSVDGVTKRYEITAVWNVLNDIISSNIIDPLTGEQARATTSDWIRNGVPNPAKLGQVGGFKFPIIVLRQTEIEDKNVVVDASKDMITHTVSIECHAVTRLQAAQLSEEIRYILKVTGQSELRIAALYGPDVLGSSEDTDFIGANKYYVKTLDYQFMRMD